MFTIFAKRAAAQIGTIFSWVYTILDVLFDWVGRSTADDDMKQLLNDKLPAWAHWLFSTPSWVPGLCAVILTGWLIWLSRDTAPKAISPLGRGAAARAKVHNRSSAEPGDSSSEQIKHTLSAALPPTYNALYNEADKDKEAKDAVAQFCRRHLYKLIEQERRSVVLALRELVGSDPINTLIGRYAADSIREEFTVEPRIVAATKDSTYRNLPKSELEELLSEAYKFTIYRSVFISQAIRERNFNRVKAMEIAKALYDIRKEVKCAWTEIVANPAFNTLQTKIGQNENSWGDLWMPKFTDP